MIAVRVRSPRGVDVRRRAGGGMAQL